MEPKKIGSLVETKFQTNFDLEKEPYILTEAEEKSIIGHAISSAKSHAAWKMKGLGYSDGEIMLRISETDFEKEINREAVLQMANSNKIYDEWQKENRENARLSEIKRRQDLIDTWTAENASAATATKGAGSLKTFSSLFAIS